MNDAFDWTSLLLGNLPDDELAPGQRWSTWSQVDRTMGRGPQPHPEWVVTADGAVDTELGILKTGKEADAFLIERAVPQPDGSPDPHGCLMVAKRYRELDHRSFRRDEAYTAGRVVRGNREARAARKKSAFGREVLAGEWARAEFDNLKRLFSAGVPVPYPVQFDGTEICMEFIGQDGQAAPRLHQTTPDRDELVDWADQLREALVLMGRLGLAHGDLSAYNILVDRGRLVVIDVPQMVDLVHNPNGMDLLLRDCRNVCAWFVGKGLQLDADEWFAEVVAQAW